MELYQLRQFAAVAKYENMTRAAESLNVAQPAVSKTIRNLESELGAELFERTGKGLRRTEQGDILLRYARTILEAERDARGEIEESLHRTGGLCICALSCAERISEILAGFSAEYGNLDLRISSTPEGSDLLLDSAVSRDEVPAGAVLLYDEEMCVAVPEGHRYADRESVSLTELADDPFIALSNSQSFRQISEHIFRSAGVEMHAAIECDSAALADSPAVVRHGCCTGRVRRVAAGLRGRRRAPAAHQGRTVPPVYLCADAWTVPHAEHSRVYCVFGAVFCADGVNPRQVMRRVPREELFHRVQTDAGFRASTEPYRTPPDR